MSEGDIKVILDRIDRMDERLSKGIASLAKGQETIGLPDQRHTRSCDEDTRSCDEAGGGQPLTVTLCGIN